MHNHNITYIIMHKVMWVIWWINIIIYNYTIAHQLTLITVIYTQTYIYAYMPGKNTTNNETLNFGCVHDIGLY